MDDQLVLDIDQEQICIPHEVPLRDRPRVLRLVPSGHSVGGVGISPGLRTTVVGGLLVTV